MIFTQFAVNFFIITALSSSLWGNDGGGKFGRAVSAQEHEHVRIHLSKEEASSVLMHGRDLLDPDSNPLAGMNDGTGKFGRAVSAQEHEHVQIHLSKKEASSVLVDGRDLLDPDSDPLAGMNDGTGIRKLSTKGSKNMPATTTSSSSRFLVALRIKVIVPKAMKLRAMEARVIKIVLHILTGQQDKDNDNDRRDLVSLLSTTPIVTTTGTTETECADPAANGGSMLTCYDTTITIDSEENLEGVIPPLTSQLSIGYGATGDATIDVSGQPGASCNPWFGCVSPPGLDHPVCRDGYCQDGTPGASCGVQSDCIVLPGRSNNICRNGKCTEDGTVDTPVSTFTPAAPLETFKSVRTNEEKQYKQKRILALLTSRCNLKSNSTCSCFLHTIHVLTSTSKSDQTNRIAD